MKLFGEKRLVNSVKLLPLSIKSINPIQKYPHITESYDYILKIFAIMFLLLLVKFLISFGMFSTPKLSKYVTVLVFTYNAIQCHNTHEDLLHMPHLLFCQEIISGIKPIKSGFILIIHLYFKVDVEESNIFLKCRSLRSIANSNSSFSRSHNSSAC